jgi:hypothetical protein
LLWHCERHALVSKNPAGFIRAFLICHENHRVMNTGNYQRAKKMCKRGLTIAAT